MIIILLGEGCNISWNMQKINLKGKSSIFEWFLSVSFKDINFIINKILNDIPIEITKRDEFRDIFLDTTAIRSSHYSLNNFPDRLNRRVKRFKDDILSNEPILFIREENSAYKTTESDIHAFKNLILSFNPDCNFRLLLLMPFEVRWESLQIKDVYHKENLRDNFNLLEYIQEIEKNAFSC
jgi:hypothetical protein